MAEAGGGSAECDAGSVKGQETQLTHPASGGVGWGVGGGGRGVGVGGGLGGGGPGVESPAFRCLIYIRCLIYMYMCFSFTLTR